MTATEILTALGTVLGAGGASYGVNRLKKKPPTDPIVAAIETRLSKIEARVSQNRDEIRRLFDREAPDLSDRVSRLEEDVRENAAAAAIRYDKILEGLGELRGTLLAFMKGDSIHDR